MSATMIPNPDGTFARAIAGVSVVPEDTSAVRVHVTNREGSGAGFLSPAEARALAQWLIRAADVAECNARTKKAEDT